MSDTGLPNESFPVMTILSPACQRYVYSKVKTTDDDFRTDSLLNTSVQRSTVYQMKVSLLCKF